jgi:hypothetical protein
MSLKVILIQNISDIKLFPKNILLDKDAKIFSFSTDVHKELSSQKIVHTIADDLIDQDERLDLFDKGFNFLYDFKTISNELKFEGIDLLKLFDTHELLSYLIPNLVKFVIIKRIIDHENPTKIFSSNYFKKIVNTIIKENKIETFFYENQFEEKLLWDNITIKYNIFKIPITFTLSKNNYLKIKKLIESFIGFFENTRLELDKSNKKSIVLLEFNPELWDNLLKNLKSYDGNIILVNRRRPAVWSKKSLNIIKKSNIKVLDFEHILTQDEFEQIPLLVNNYLKKINDCWKKSDFFTNSFYIENYNFWNILEEKILEILTKKVPEFIFLILIKKKLFQKIDVRCITSLHELGETEKIFLECNDKIPSLVLDHGFVERVEETKRFDKLLYVYFKDKIALWGNVRKNYLINQHGISSERIFVIGSPRHDVYFNSRSKKRITKEITLLLAPNPIGEFSGLASTNLELKFENTIKKIISILKDLDIKIIVKLHQIQLKHNNEIKNIITKIDKNIPIHIISSTIEIIHKSDVVLVVSSESFGTSTMLMESMILGKPTMNIILDKKIPQFTHVIDSAVMTISYNAKLKENLEKFLFDKDFQNQLIKNADHFIEKFIQNRGNASESCATLLKSF